MNFQDIYNKIKALDETQDLPSSSVATDQELYDTDVEECGMPGMTNMPSGMMGSPKQQDNVTMNVSMNGSGAGGIRDLMSILKDLEGGQSRGDKDMIIGVGETGSDGGFGDATTSPNQRTAPISAVVPTGNDIHSKGAEAEKVNGGGNPFNVDESLVARLSTLYTEVKSR
jgi:hypothetical protein